MTYINNNKNKINLLFLLLFMYVVPIFAVLFVLFYKIMTIVILQLDVIYDNIYLLFWLHYELYYLLP